MSAPNPQLFGPRSDGLQSEITLRDLFAMASAQALVGSIVHGAKIEGNSYVGENIARQAYDMAEWMLAERAKRAAS